MIFAFKVFPLTTATVPLKVSWLVAVCSSVPDSFTARLLSKVVPDATRVPSRSLAVAPSI